MRPLQIIGITLGAAISGMLILFIGGEMLTDPGGIKGLLMVIGWLALPAASVATIGKPPGETPYGRSAKSSG